MGSSVTRLPWRVASFLFGLESHNVTGTRKALTLSFLERYTGVALYAAASIILSRVLTPRDIGLFSIGYAVTALIGQFRDFGVATYLIQEPSLTREKFRAAFGLSITTSLLVAGLVVLGSQLAGMIYSDPGVTRVMLVTALSLLFTPLNAMSLMWQRREMRYGVLLRATLVGAVCQTCVTTGLALLGYGYMSLAWGSVANSFGNVLVNLRFWPRQFGYLPSWRAWQPIMSFGIYSTLGSLGQEITPRAGDLFVGRLTGVAALGQFSRANSLIGFVNGSLISAVLPVALSVIAMKRRASEAIGPACLAAASYLTVIVWPVFGFTAVMAFPIIRVLFGNQWDEAVPPARLLAFAAMATSLLALHPAIYQASGALRQRMVVQVIVTPVQVALLFAAAPFGLVAVAAASVLNALMELIISQIAVNRIAGMTMPEIGGAVAGSAFVMAVSAALPVLTLFIMPPDNNNVVLPLVLAAIGATIGWLGSVFALGHPIAEEISNALLHARRFVLASIKV